jgi:hypothetical protein
VERSLHECTSSAENAAKAGLACQACTARIFPVMLPTPTVATLLPIQAQSADFRLQSLRQQDVHLAVDSIQPFRFSRCLYICRFLKVISIIRVPI